MLNKIKILKTDELDFDKIHYTNVDSDNRYNIKIINMLYIHNNKKIPLLIEIDDLYMMDDIISTGENHEIILPLIGRSSNVTTKVKTFFETLDNKVINDAKQYKVIWNLNDNIKYKKIVKDVELDDNKQQNDIFVKNSDDQNYTNFMYNNGLIKFKLVQSDNFNTIIFDKNKNIINKKDYVNSITGGNYIKSIVEIVAIWAKEDIFGLYIRPHQFKITSGSPPIFTLKEYSFNDDNDNDNNEQTNNNLISDTEICIQQKPLKDTELNLLQDNNMSYSMSDNDSDIQYSL